MTKNVAGFRFTKAERGLLVSVFERFDGKTPSRGVCDAIARAFTRSPVRDPTRRALAAVDDDLAAAAPPPAAGVLLPGDAATTDNPCAVNAGFGLFAPSPFRGAAWRAAADAADGGAATAANGRGDGGANAFESDDATRLPAPETKYPYVVAPVPVVDASLSSLPTHAKTHPDEKNAFEEFFEESAEEAPEEAWADAVADARDTRDPRGAAAAALSSESGDGSSRDDETKSFLGTPHAETSAQTPSPLDAFVGRASRLERLVRLEKGVAAARNRAFQRDVAAWQPVGTSLYIGERAETATPTRARRVSSPSPSPPPPDPAPAVPFLPETPNVLASEENGVDAAPLAAGASFFPRPGADDDSVWSGSELADARDARDDEGPESDGGLVDASIATIASRGAIGALDERAVLGVAGLSAGLFSSRAYAPGVSLEALVREKDDNLAAALALGARTGRWVPLTGGDGAEPRDDGSDGAAAFTHVVPSAAAQAAMVVSAAEELGDGEAHPVTWKQIKTWFENRRMTQKRIKEGSARPPRRNNNAGTHLVGADESADARAAKKANDRGKPPRPPFSGKTRSSPPAARRSLDETRFDATARPGAKRARTDASGKPLGLSARRSLELDRLEMDRFDAAAAAAAAAEDLRARDTSWGEPTSALTREMSWADIHDALAGAERARAP